MKNLMKMTKIVSWYFQYSSHNQAITEIPMDENSSTIPMGEITIHNQLGEGNFGAVYLGKCEYFINIIMWHVMDDTWQGGITDVALKALKDALDDQEFKSELKILTKLKHPSNLSKCQHVNNIFTQDVVSFLGTYRDNEGTPYLVFEYLPRGSLLSLLRKKKELSVVALIRLSLEAAKGMEYLQQKGIIHRWGWFICGELNGIKCID